MKTARKSRPPAKASELRILVCGSRDWPNTEEGTAVIRKQLAKVILEHGVRNDDVLVVTGSIEEEDNGVDSIVECLCRTELGLACAVFRAPWEWARRTIGNARPAGPIRNGWMARWFTPNFVLAFHPYLPNSRGTKNMCEQARAKGIPVRVIEK